MLLHKMLNEEVADDLSHHGNGLAKKDYAKGCLSNQDKPLNGSH